MLFESVPNKGRYIQITTKDKTGVNIMRNFSIILLVRQHMYIRVVYIVRQAPVICWMAPPIHLGAWSMAMG